MATYSEDEIDEQLSYQVLRPVQKDSFLPSAIPSFGPQALI